MKQLAGYLDKIARDEPIVLSKFKTLIQKLELGFAFNESDIEARRVNNQSYVVTNIAPALHLALKQLAGTQLDDRISAAQQNRSHNHKVVGNFLLVRDGRAHPNVVIIDEHGHATPSEQTNKSVLLIENRQLFLSIDKTLDFIEQHCSIALTNSFDVILSAGNEITNSLFQDYLNHYDTFFLFFDLEFGALQSAASLYAQYPKKEITFVLPKDIEARLERVVQVLPHENIDKVIQIGLDQPKLAYPAKLIKEHRKKLEQESYLYGH